MNLVRQALECRLNYVPHLPHCYSKQHIGHMATEVTAKSRWNTSLECVPNLLDGERCPFPKMNMDPKQWESKLLVLLDESNQQLFTVMKQHLQLPRDNPNCQFLIDRFLLSTRTTIASHVEYLKQKHKYDCKCTVDELYQNRLFAKAVMQDAARFDSFEEGIFLKLCERTSMLNRKQESWNQNEQNQWYANYLLKQEKLQKEQVESQQQGNDSGEPDETCAAHIVQLRDWMTISTQSNQRGDIWICPAAIYFQFRLPFTKFTASGYQYSSGNNAKSGKVRALGYMTPKPLYSVMEIQREMIGSKKRHKNIKDECLESMYTTAHKTVE